MVMQRATTIAALFVALCLSPYADAHNGSIRGTPLPNWEASWEKDVIVDYNTEKEKDWGEMAKAASAQPPSGIRLPAEFEPTEAVVMSWKAFRGILQDVSKEVAKAGAKVLMIRGPATLSGVPSDQYHPLSLASNSVWARDYGPVGVLRNGDTEPAIIDTRYRHYQRRIYDDNVPCSIAQQEGMECFSTELILDGGNLMSDGAGNIFMTTRTYDWNNHMTRDQVDALLRSYFGAETIHPLDYAKDSMGEPSDGTGHIDMFVKILDQCVVLVAETNDAPYRQPLEDAANYFGSLECAPGQTYTVHRVPGWVSSRDGETWYTYTNSLIVNDVVIIPTYSSGPNNAAINIYQSARPDMKIVGVNTDESITLGGSIHCLTRQIPLAS